MDASLIEVCAAVMKRGSSFLLAKRHAGAHLEGHWEFPGGKVHKGETLFACMEREIKEELGIGVRAENHLATIDHIYPEKSIRLHFLSCKLDNGARPVGLLGQEIGWFDIPQILQLDMAEADRRFVAEFLVSSKRKNF